MVARVKNTFHAYVFIFFCSFWNPLVLPYLLYPAPLDLLAVQIVDYIMSLAQKGSSD